MVWIRSDWLKNLGLPVPRTAAKLFKAARAFAVDDPDGNGKNDTYGIAMDKSGIADRTVKAAWIFIATIPILAVYPALQRYFISGIMIGRVKDRLCKICVNNFNIKAIDSWSRTEYNLLKISFS